MSRSKINKTMLMEAYRWMVISCGSAVAVVAIIDIFSRDLHADFIFLLILTAVVTSRVNIKFPRFHGSITVSDAFIFVALLLWGAPAAVITAAVESVASTIRIRSRLARTYLFNVSASAGVTFLTALILESVYGSPAGISKNLAPGAFILAMCLIALSQYLGSMLVNSILQAFKLGADLWKTWSTYFLWSCITFIIGAAIAGIAIKLLNSVGFIAIILVSPIILLVYLTYRSYLKSHAALQESEARFRSSFNYATIGMALVSADGKLLQVNQSLSEILSLPEEKLVSSYYQDVIHNHDLAQITKSVRSLVENKTPAFQTEVRFAVKGQNEVWCSLGVSPARDLQGSIRHFIFQIQDVTLRKQAESKLRHDAFHDPLTGLPNRKAFLTNLEKALVNAPERKRNFLATLFLDVDGFKIINDSLGHNVGDELLQVISKRLLDCVRGHDTVARLGGDEFTILLERIADTEQVLMVAKRIIESISKPVILYGQEISVNASIGIATSEFVYTNSNDMLRDADAAMYQAKARGKGCYVVFDETMYANATRKLRLANDLRNAAERTELTLFYQPVKSIRTNKFCRFEALMRWNHPEFGLMMPNDFIPIAEENGFITSLDNWALAEACRQLRTWQISNPGMEDFLVSVNASNKQFAQTDFIENVSRILKDTGLDPQFLQLEITESVMAEDLKNTIRVLKKLNDLGVQIALDDFGTGYSSLNYLHELPISTLKIDRSFIMRLTTEPGTAEIVRTIILLARNLKMEVVAEGVETIEQLERVSSLGCDLAQGFLFSHSLPPEHAIDFVISGNAEAAILPTTQTDQKDLPLIG